jgi:hypothetical protein
MLHVVQEVLPVLAPNLNAPSQAQRAAVLKLLSSFKQPVLPGGDSARQPSTIFLQFAQIESQVQDEGVCILVKACLVMML